MAAVIIKNNICGVDRNTLAHTGLCALLFLYVMLCCITSCGRAPKEVPVVDIDNPTGYINLKLSDLLDDITIVPLETRDDFLLSTEGSRFTSIPFAITDNYILASTNDKLLQLDRQGNYVRTLITRGRGPNEFIYILAHAVDEQQEILYYADS